MTPTVSRMVAAKRQELGYPLRWYSIPNLWRYERPQKGRLREHWQLNVDLFGVADLTGDVEIIEVVDAIMRSLGAKHSMYKIRLNSRPFVDYLLKSYLRLDDVQAGSVGKLIDRMHKMPADEFITKVDGFTNSTQRGAGVVEKLQQGLAATKLDELPVELRQHQSVQDLRTALGSLEKSGITNVQFDPTLMRGFDYYTGLVFEVFDTNPDNARSLFGGGRYDGLVGLFGVEPVPTVGFGMGDVMLAEFLKTHDLVPKLRSTTNLYVAVVGGDEVLSQTKEIVNQLRKDEVNVAFDITGRSLDKQLKTADKDNIRYVLIVGPSELESQQFKLKDLETGKEESHALTRIASIVQDHRNLT
jgi:histidyl-tRNA synthetase